MILTDDYPPLGGGVATFAQTVARGLCREGHEVVVFARQRPGLGGEEFSVNGVRGPSFGRRGGWWMALATWGKLSPADQVLGVTWPVVSRLRHPNINLVFHGSDLTSPPHSQRGFRRACRRARRRVVMSRFLAEVLRQRGFSAELIAAPVDAAVESAPIRLGPPRRWAYVARATELKGGDRFIRLVALAKVQGTVMGDGPALDSWKDLAAKLGANVTFTGNIPREDLAACLAEQDLCLLLPREGESGGAEGFGLALLEAAAQGVPVVGCRTGGVPEAVGPGLILENPDDTPAALAAIDAWWSSQRGAEALTWLRHNHGVSRTLSALQLLER